MGDVRIDLVYAQKGILRDEIVNVFIKSGSVEVTGDDVVSSNDVEVTCRRA